MEIKWPDWLTKKRYRVVEVVMGDNTSMFYPQQQYRLLRFAFVWRPCSDLDYSARPALEYSSLEGANKYLFNLEKANLAKTIIKKRNHEFNSLFHKLKQTENE